MVHAEGFEPPTLGSEDRCSIQLSYACKRSYCTGKNQKNNSQGKNPYEPYGL